MRNQRCLSQDIRLVRCCAFLGRNMLKLRSIGISDYAVLEGGQRIGRIRFAEERLPPRWLWLPHGRDGVQGSLEGVESPDHAGAARGGLPRNEHPGRRLISACV